MRSGPETRRPTGQPAAIAVGRPLVAGQALDAGPSDIGPLFRDLRRCLNLSLPELARRLETRIDVIAALEAGDFARLPPWPETVRIVSAFTLLGKIDPRPVLHVLRHNLEQGVPVAPSGMRERSPRAGSRQPTEVPAQSRSGPERGGGASGSGVLPSRLIAAARLPRLVLPAVPQAIKGGLERVGRRPLAALAAACCVAVIAAFSALSTGQQQASAAAGAGFLSRMLGLGDAVARHAPVRDGLRWIEVADPRTRRADKLRTADR